MSGIDFRVADTIISILVQFFSKNEDILLYSPSDTDGRELNRLRLFDIWLNYAEKHIDTTEIEIQRAEIKYESSSVIVTLIYKKSQEFWASRVLNISKQGLIDESKPPSE